MNQELQDLIKERKALHRQDIAERAASAKTRCPELVDEFLRLKEMRKLAGHKGFDWRMFQLQMDILYGEHWEWSKHPLEIEGYSEEELSTIDNVAEKFFKDIDYGFRNNLPHVQDKWYEVLMAELQKAGIDTTGKEDAIFENTIFRVHRKSFIRFILHGNVSEEFEGLTEELRYY